MVTDSTIPQTDIMLGEERVLDTVKQIIVAIAIIQITRESKKNPNMISDFSVGLLSNMTGINYHAVLSVVEKLVKKRVLQVLLDQNYDELPRYRLAEDGENRLTLELKEFYSLLRELFSSDDNSVARSST